MNNFIRKINQNWQFIVIGGLVLLVLIGFFSFYSSSMNKIENEEREEANLILTNRIQANEEMTNRQMSGNGEIGNEVESNTAKPTKTPEIIQETVEKFGTFLLNKNYEQAYNLLSSECKNKMYSDFNMFRNNYCRNIFESASRKEVKVDDYKDQTYKFQINQDRTSEGIIEYKNILTDYITVVKENDQDKLNISGFIGLEEVNKDLGEEEKINCIVKSQEVYKDYIILKLTMTNKTGKKIMLDSGRSTQMMYLQGQNENFKWKAIRSEILDSGLILYNNESLTVTIKYNKPITSSEVKHIVFEDVILDYDAYQRSTNKSYFSNTTSITYDYRID